MRPTLLKSDFNRIQNEATRRDVRDILIRMLRCCACGMAAGFAFGSRLTTLQYDGLNGMILGAAGGGLLGFIAFVMGALDPNR